MRIQQPLLSTIALVLAAQFAVGEFAASDVMLQTIDGKIATGVIDDNTNEGVLGVRVYPGNLLSNFKAANPGFYSLTSASPNLPPGASGFPSRHDVYFELLPMQIGELRANLLYWNGVDVGGNGLTLDDVQFTAAASVLWEIRDDASVSYFADGTDQIISGGRIGTTSSDTNLSDGIDTGLLHKHLAFSLNSTVEGGSPSTGIYAIAWQVRSAGFEKSDPFVFVHRTSTETDSARNLATDWIEQNLDMLFPSILPGDYNDDGLVDASDYTAWRDAFGSTTALPNEDASPNVVDSADYDVWNTNFGTTNASRDGEFATRTAPEPTTFVFAFLATTAPPFLLSGRRRQLVAHLD